MRCYIFFVTSKLFYYKLTVFVTGDMVYYRLDVAQLALFNLTIVHNRKYFDLRDMIIPWVKENWDRLQLSKVKTSVEGKAKTNLKHLPN